MNVVYLRLLGVDCWNLQVTAYKAVRKLLGRPIQLLAVGSIDRFLPLRMCGFTAVTGIIITKLTLIQQANLMLTHWIFNLREPFYAV